MCEQPTEVCDAGNDVKATVVTIANDVHAKLKRFCSVTGRTIKATAERAIIRHIDEDPEYQAYLQAQGANESVCDR